MSQTIILYARVPEAGSAFGQSSDFEAETRRNLSYSCNRSRDGSRNEKGNAHTAGAMRELDSSNLNVLRRTSHRQRLVFRRFPCVQRFSIPIKHPGG